MIIAHKKSHGTNVVVVNNQSAKNKKDLLLFDWMLTTTTFVLWDMAWAMILSHVVYLGNIDILSTRRRLRALVPVSNVGGHKDDEENDAGNAVVPEDKHRANLLYQNAAEDRAAKFAESVIKTLEEGLRRRAEVWLSVVRDEGASCSPHSGVGNSL